MRPFPPGFALHFVIFARNVFSVSRGNSVVLPSFLSLYTHSSISLRFCFSRATWFAAFLPTLNNKSISLAPQPSKIEPNSVERPCLAYVLQRSRKINEPNVTVDIDGSKFSRRKYNKRNAERAVGVRRCGARVRKSISHSRLGQNR